MVQSHGTGQDPVRIYSFSMRLHLSHFFLTLLNKRFGEDWARLTKDLFDSEDSLKFKPERWNDIQRVILPQLIDEVCQLLLLDLVVENLTLQDRNLFPNSLIGSQQIRQVFAFQRYQGRQLPPHQAHT